MHLPGNEITPAPFSEGIYQASSSALVLGAGAIPASLVSDAKAGAPSVSEVMVTKYMDKASPSLVSHSSTGEHYSTVLIP